MSTHNMFFFMCGELYHQTLTLSISLLCAVSPEPLLSTHCLLQPMLRSGSEVTQKVLIVTAVQWENSSMLIRLLMVIVVI